MQNTDSLNTNSAFSSLLLKEALLTNLATLNYIQMTPIQSLSLPTMLEGIDVIAQAKTGSGKTAAFGLTLLNHLNQNLYKVQALVLCPTRELADQVSQAIRTLARLLPNIKILNLSGGKPIRPQIDSLKSGAHIIVGTPGRIQKHLETNALSLDHLKNLVLDEADRMLDMGFFDAIKSVIKFCPSKRQTLLFSATYPAQIKRLARDFMTKPEHVVAEASEQPIDIDQCFYEASHHNEKFDILISLLNHHQPESVLIFCNTKEQTTNLTNLLTHKGYSSIALNGDMEQIDRDSAMIRFVNRSCPILVATDVAARGLDIKELPAVINYDLAFELDSHIHRIGRTGRAGSRGLALSITTPKDAERLCNIENYFKTPITWGKSGTLSTQSSDLFKVPKMVTLCLASGRKDKIRPGDILGALTKDAKLLADYIGKIDITPLYSYVAVQKDSAETAYQYFRNGKLKGRKIHVRKLNIK